MPTDVRRIAGPENSTPYLQFVQKPTDDATPVSISSWKRKNGRNASHCRPMYMRLGTVVHAQGSCYLEMGTTKVVASVYGPRSMTKSQLPTTASAELDCQLGQLTCELNFAAFSCRRGRVPPAPGDRERQLSEIMHTSLEPSVCLHKFPSLCCSVYVYVLEDDGGALSAAIISASMALADAGVPLYDIVACSSLLNCDGTHLVDPDMDELDLFCSVEGQGDHNSQETSSTVTLAFMPQLEQVSSLYADGWMQSDIIDANVTKLTDNCRQIHVLMRNTLLDKIDAKNPPSEGTKRVPEDSN